MHELLVQWAGYVIPWIEACGIAAVLWAVLTGIFALARRAWRLVASPGHADDLGAVRLAMGEKMVLGLEFFLAGDIIQTIVVPTWETLGILAGI